MADLVITAGSVLPGASAITESGLAGEAITAGQVVYKDATGAYFKADANGGTATIRTGRGIALNGAGAGQPLVIQRAGEITIGAALTPGTTYYLSDTPGGICPLADLLAGEYFHIVGIAKSASVLLLALAYSGVSA